MKVHVKSNVIDAKVSVNPAAIKFEIFIIIAILVMMLIFASTPAVYYTCIGLIILNFVIMVVLVLFPLSYEVVAEGETEEKPETPPKAAKTEHVAGKKSLNSPMNKVPIPTAPTPEPEPEAPPVALGPSNVKKNMPIMINNVSNERIKVVNENMEKLKLPTKEQAFNQMFENMQQAEEDDDFFNLPEETQDTDQNDYI